MSKTMTTAMSMDETMAAVPDGRVLAETGSGTGTGIGAGTSTITTATNTDARNAPHTTDISKMFTSGKGFYDDGYNEEELSAKLETKLNLSNIPLMGRQAELKKLRNVYQCMLERSSEAENGNSNSNNNDAYTNSASPTAGQSTNANEGASCSTPVVFVRGASGTGKTKMINQFIKDLQQDLQQDLEQEPNDNSDGNHNKPEAPSVDQRTSSNPGTTQDTPRPSPHTHTSQTAQDGDNGDIPSLPYFIQGKTDEHIQDSDPFSAIIQALNDFCRQVGNSSSAERQRIRRRIRKHLGSQANVISKLVPAIHTLLSSGNAKTSNVPQSQLNSATDESAAQQHPSQLSAKGAPIDDIKQHQSVASVSASDAPDSAQMKRLVEQLGAKADAAWNQLRYTLTTLLHAISTKQRPVILFLDDLQWSSQVSIDLISTFLCDKNLKYFLMIGAVRQDTNPHSPGELLDLNDDNPLRKMMETLCTPAGSNLRHESATETSASKHQVSSPWTDLVLAHHTKQEIAECLSIILNRTVEDLEPFTSRIYGRAEGNIFFTLQLVEQLQESNILAYSHITFQWEWHWPQSKAPPSSASSARSAGSDSYALPFARNIVELMSHKLSRLSPQLKAALACAAYIRATFDLSTLRMVLNAQPASFMSLGDNTCATAEPIISAEKLENLLEEAVLQGFLTNFTGGSTYCFAHDRIQQAAYESVPFGEDRCKLKSRIGKCLFDYCRPSTRSTIDESEDTDDVTSADELGDDDYNDENSKAYPLLSADGQVIDQTLLYVAADHLNSVPTKDHLFIAKLNLQAGDLALSMAALAQASVYYRSAATAMRKIREPWNRQYKLNLRLCTSRARIELALGRYELGYELSQAVLDHAKTLNEKLPTYASMIQALGAQDKQQEGLRLGRKVTQSLRSYPKGSYGLHALRKMMMVRRYTKRVSDEEIMCQPLATNSTDILPLVFLREVAIRSFLCQNAFHLLLSTFSIILWSKKHGITEDVGLAFASYGLFMGKLGDEQSALRFGRLSVKIMNRMKSPSIRGLAHILCALYIHPWSEPIGPLVNGYIPCYISSMERGTFSDALTCWQTCNFLAQAEGYPLQDIYRSYTELVDQMRLYKISSATGFVKQGIRFSSVLLGHEAVDWEEFRDFGESGDISSLDVLEFRMAFTVLLQLCVMFHKYDIAEAIITRHKKAVAGDSSYARAVQRVVCTGLTAAALYRQTRQKKYMKWLKEMRKMIRTMCRKKGLSSINRSLLLRAELLSVTKASSTAQQLDKVKQAYEDAIVSSIDCGHVHDAALACELAGEYMLANAKICGKSDIVEMFTRSYEYYRQWGAVLKLEHLKQERGEFINEKLYVRHNGDQGNKMVVINSGTGIIRNAITGKVLPTFDYRSHYNLIYANQKTMASAHSGSVHTTPTDALTHGENAHRSPRPPTEFERRNDGDIGDAEDDEVSVLTDVSNL